MVELLNNPIRSYAWGSPTVLSSLLGRQPTGEPQAELWVGAHPGSPSTLATDGRSLLDYVDSDTARTLGERSLMRFGPRLPFLLKILAVARPLSIQVHPTLKQAADGFAADDAAGIPLDSPRRMYRDTNHKPEMVVALTDFSALLGFRQPAEAADLLRSLGIPEMRSAADVVETDGGLERMTRTWLNMPADAASRLADAVSESAPVGDIAEYYPGDRGVLVALLLNRITLRPGEAAFVGPGVPHAYLHGVAVEPQASSDNTLRAGLTVKHVDVAEVLRLLDYTPSRGVAVRPRQTSPNTATYAVKGVDEFTLTRFDGDASLGAGPRLVLVVEGEFDVTTKGGTVSVPPGRAAFVRADEPDSLIRGTGVAYAVGTALNAAG